MFGTVRITIGLTLALGAGFWVYGPRSLAAQEFRVAAVRHFGEVFSPASDPAVAQAFRGALRMRWDGRKRFRGFSGLHLDPGNRLTAVSDRGSWFAVTLLFHEGFLTGAKQPVLKRLTGPGGARLKDEERDAEALAPDGRGGFVVAFERRARLLHYPAWRKPFFLTPVPLPAPADVAALRENGGIEALARLCDGRLLALAQSPAEAGKADAWIGDGDVWTGRRYRRSDGYSPTGAATLPDCSVAVLERRAKGAQGHGFRVRRLPASMLSMGDASALDSAALFGPAFTPALKFEGIAAMGEQRGGVQFYVISDSGRGPETTLAAFILSQAQISK